MRVLVLLAILGELGMASAQSSKDRVVIDGQLDESFWSRIAPAKLAPVDAAVLADGGQVRALLFGRYLYLAARMPESSGRFTARSVGTNPNWGEEDSLKFVIRVAHENDWMLKIGPLGAYSVHWRWTGEPEWYTSRPEKFAGFLVTSSLGEGEWRVEAAIPLSELGSPNTGAVHINAERVRAQRLGTPEQHWRWPSDQPMSEVPGSPQGAGVNSPDPEFRPFVAGNKEVAIEVGRSKAIPSVDSEWDDASWRDAPVWTLSRNEPAARIPIFPTQVKMLHDGRTLAIIARCAEPDAPVAEVKERDGEIDRDDNIQVYLATSGSSYVKYAINPRGYVQDANGFSGGPRASRPHVEWDSPVRAAAHQLRGEWVARLDLPLDFIARALGEAESSGDWRILVVRHRMGRSGEPEETSVLPVIQTSTPYCPARYRRLVLVDKDPSQLHGHEIPPPSGNLAFSPTRVLSSEQRKQTALAGMLDKNIHDRVLKVLEREKRDWDRVQTLDDWKSFRDPKWKALAASLGEFPSRGPLQTRVIKEFRGDRYRRQDLVYQSQPGFWVTANLYLPNATKEHMPGIVIAHSLHGPKTQFELQDMGILWSRAGCAVLVMDQIGYGERLEGHPLEGDFYQSRYITGMQLYLVGESLIKWMSWDIMRGIDLLMERKDVDQERVILLGSVAGGGDPAAIVAALDNRVAAVVPFNFGESTPEIPRFIPEKNQWPLELADPGLIDADTTRCLRRGVIDQFLQWTICAMAAPRRLVYSYELGWNVQDLPAWSRYKKVYELYHASDHLADAHGFGPYPGPGECWNIGPAQRRSLYPTLERWFGIPIPFEGIRTSARANLAREGDDRQPESELAVLTPASARDLKMRSVHELTREIGQAKVEKVRSVLADMTPLKQREWMRTELSKRLGDVEPTSNPTANVHWSKTLANSTVEGITIAVEPGIIVPLLLFRPSMKGGNRVPVVVAVAEGGKELFLATRNREIEALLRQGVAVCLPDVRGTGETSPDDRRDPQSDENIQAINEEMLGETLLGRRLKDLRTVLIYLETRPDLESKRIALWGESLMPVNGSRLIDELSPWEVGPEIQQHGEPLGGLLAILGALYDDHVRTLAVRNGLASYSSILEDAFAYVPPDITVPGFLEVGDLADVEAALAPTPILLEDLIDGKDRLISAADLRTQLAPLHKAYRDAPENLSVRSGATSSEMTEWLLAHL
jgi:dienelactone hydrolase